MGKRLGYDVAHTDAELEAAASELNGDYSTIQYWRPGSSVSSLYENYAASYHIFKTLGDEYGGLTLYSKFFRGLQDLKSDLKSTNIAVYQLGLAAGVNLFPVFSEWKFELVDVSGISARISRLQTEADWYGPLLPFREQALNHLKLAQSSMYTLPEAAMGHVTIAAFYIETVPMIIAGIALAIILLVVVALLVRRRNRRRAVEFSSYGTTGLAADAV
jgi:hypothetical protein